jgi:DNA repair protein RAD7
MANLNPKLERLHLHCCGQMDSSVLQYWAKPTTFRSLARLELFAPYLVRAEAWQTFLTSKGPQLTGFLITNSPRFDEACMLTLVQNCTKLEELKLSEVGKLKDSWLKCIHQLELLRSLSLSRPAESLTDKPVVELLGNIGARLEHLDLSGNDELTDVLLLRRDWEELYILAEFGFVGGHTADRRGCSCILRAMEARRRNVLHGEKYGRFDDGRRPSCYQSPAF